MSNYGISAKNGATLSIKHINAAGGVLGTKLEVVSQDDACDSAKATRVAEEMVAENVIAVIGHICNNFDRSSFAKLLKRKYSGYICCFEQSKPDE
ncbi:MAG: ABC transporter substrate-binding protein [SAR324 cluster bacterium]|nr:ABC transporter substrate-binding protein [SAR324 cluster bacterium]